MTTEQEEMWKILTLDAEYIANHYGAELAVLATDNEEEFHRLADHLLDWVMNNIKNPNHVIAILRTWLKKYSLPIDVNLLTSFDRFHREYGLLVIDSTHSGQEQILF